MDSLEENMLPAETEDLRPLPTVLHSGLTAVAVLACISLVSSTLLFVHLTYKLVKWKRRAMSASSAAASRRASSSDGQETQFPGFDLSLGLAEPHMHGAGPGEHGQQQEPDGGTPPRNVLHAHGWRWWRSKQPPNQRQRAAVPSPEPNQFLVLIYNLLLADMHQAMAFVLNAVWVGSDAIRVHSSSCWAQGFFVSTGDLSASLFITAIAIHTYSVISRGYRPPQWAVNATCIGIWAFTYGMLFLGLIATNHGKSAGGFYVRAAAWCWINQEFETLRLVTHYLFIFISLALTSILYTLVFLSLKRRQNGQRSGHRRRLRGQHIQLSSLVHGRTAHPSTKSSIDSHTNTMSSPAATSPGTDVVQGSASYASSDSAPDGGHHPAFLIYPIIYVLCTLPLALGRIATMAGADVPLSYFCAAGALITCNGWLDVLLWGSTRRRLIFGTVDDGDVGLSTFSFVRTPPNRRFGNIVWVEGGTGGDARQSGSAMAGRMRSASRDLTGFFSHAEGGNPAAAAATNILRGVRDRMQLTSMASKMTGGPGGSSREASVSQESLRGETVLGDEDGGDDDDDDKRQSTNTNEAGTSGGLEIQMDTETTVVVEVEQVRPQKSQQPSVPSPKYNEKDMPYLPPIE